jgi:hypothetical protein
MHTPVCEGLILAIAEMDRQHLVEMLRSMQCGFSIDFSDEFLASMSLERLRHVTLAAAMHSRSAAVQ